MSGSTIHVSFEKSSCRCQFIISFWKLYAPPFQNIYISALLWQKLVSYLSLKLLLPLVTDTCNRFGMCHFEPLVSVLFFRKQIRPIGLSCHKLIGYDELFLKGEGSTKKKKNPKKCSVCRGNANPDLRGT